VVLTLIDEGYTKAYALKGGWYEWLQAKYPVEKK
jgi:rhodanese-related sulfurtransferase